eukprot:INCI7466.2.p1 GENE.INCI7466.2~~INCI7466.2.p1  ORF type:complete len:238 (+),score=39.19 INCI7466.2:302-1015(+)
MPSIARTVLLGAFSAAGVATALHHGPFDTLHSGESADPWRAVTGILVNATAAKVFPGAVAVVGDHTGTLYSAALGNYTNDGRNPPFHPHDSSSVNPTPTVDTTKFDMASCTKVVATTSAVALLYQRGFLGLEDKVEAFLGAAYAANGKENITVQNCLLHNAGYPPDPSPNYWDPTFGCAGAPLPQNMSFACSSKIFAGLLNQTLDRPINTKFVASPWVVKFSRHTSPRLLLLSIGTH